MKIGAIWNHVPRTWPLTFVSKINSLIPFEVKIVFWVDKGQQWVIQQGSLWPGFGAQAFWLLIYSIGGWWSVWIILANEFQIIVPIHPHDQARISSAPLVTTETHPQDLLASATFAEILFLEASGPCHEERASSVPHACLLPSAAMESALSAYSEYSENWKYHNEYCKDRKYTECWKHIELEVANSRFRRPGFKSCLHHLVYKWCLREINFLRFSGSTFKEDSSHHMELLWEISWLILNVHRVPAGS